MAEAVTRTLGGSAAWYGRQSLPVGIPRQSLGTRANEGERGRYEGDTRAIRGRYEGDEGDEGENVLVFPSLAPCHPLLGGVRGGLCLLPSPLGRG